MDEIFAQIYPVAKEDGREAIRSMKQTADYAGVRSLAPIDP